MRKSRFAEEQMVTALREADRTTVAEGALGIEVLFMRSDNGPEFVSQAILKGVAQAGIATALNDTGKRWQNGADKCFNGKLRDACLSLEWFKSRNEAAALIEAWRRRYNAVRPHSSLGYLIAHESLLGLRSIQ